MLVCVCGGGREGRVGGGGHPGHGNVVFSATANRFLLT